MYGSDYVFLITRTGSTCIVPLCSHVLLVRCFNGVYNNNYVKMNGVLVENTAPFIQCRLLHEVVYYLFNMQSLQHVRRHYKPVSVHRGEKTRTSKKVMAITTNVGFLKQIRFITCILEAIIGISLLFWETINHHCTPNIVVQISCDINALLQLSEFYIFQSFILCQFRQDAEFSNSDYVQSNFYKITGMVQHT